MRGKLDLVSERLDRDEDESADELVKHSLDRLAFASQVSNVQSAFGAVGHDALDEMGSLANKATETVKYILDRRGDLRQRPKVLQRIPEVDTQSFLGKLGAVDQPLGTTIQEQVFNSKPLPVKSPEAEAVLRQLREELER